MPIGYKPIAVAMTYVQLTIFLLFNSSDNVFLGEKFRSKSTHPTGDLHKKASNGPFVPFRHSRR